MHKIKEQIKLFSDEDSSSFKIVVEGELTSGVAVGTDSEEHS